MNKRLVHFFAFMLIGCYIFHLKGQNITTDTVEVKARKLSESERSAIPMQTLNQVELERIGVTTVSDALKHMTGVQVKDYGGIGGLKTVSVRSLGAQHTSVMYDGVAVSDCQTGQADISRYTISNVETLTLTIGQSDDIFLPAKQLASAGVLSINTQQLNTQCMASLRTGSYGLVNPTLLYGTFLGSKLHLMAHADYQRADGNYRFHMKNGLRDINEKRNNSDIETWRAELNFTYLPSSRQTLRLKAYLFDSDRGLPGNVVYDNTYAAERSHDRNYFGQLNYENRLSNRWKLSASGKYNWTWSQYTDKTIARNVDERFRQTEVYGNAVLLYKPHHTLAVSMAQDVTYNYLHTNQQQCIFPSRFSILTAVSCHFTKGIVSSTASLLNTVVLEHARTGTPADDRHRMSPAVSISIRPFRLHNWRLRFSYKDIFRNPTFNDLYYLLMGNRSLQPEKTRQYNIGTIWNQSFNGWLKYANISVDAYYGTVDDKIVAIPKMFFWTMYNIGKVKTKGIDLSAQLEGTIKDDIKWYMLATYNYMDSKDVTDPTMAAYRHQLPYTPLHSGSASLSIETSIVNLTYNLIWTDKRYSMQINMPSTRIPAYSDHSVSLSRTFNINGNRLKLQGDILNIGNKNYEVVRFYPMPGRNYQFSLSYLF